MGGMSEIKKISSSRFNLYLASPPLLTSIYSRYVYIGHLETQIERVIATYLPARVSINSYRFVSLQIGRQVGSQVGRYSSTKAINERTDKTSIPRANIKRPTVAIPRHYLAMPASLHPLHSLCAFPSKKHNQSPESRPRDPRDGMKIRLNDYLRSAYSRIGEAGRRLPTNRARCIERKIASRDPLSKIIPPRIPASLVTWPATTRLLARMRSFARDRSID